MRLAQDSNHNATYETTDDAGEGRSATGYSNTQTKGEGYEENDHAGEEVGTQRFFH
jgi:hypothetical protein